MITLKVGDSLMHDGLTITHLGGGHKITMDDNGKRSGDLSFADVLLATKNMDGRKVRFFRPDERKATPVAFDIYLISVRDMGWNGTFVELEISRIV